ncbi:unnamed protein product [Macrosiphum euphorbiae]|uniref:FLYWCH-type domain-containing protein n=1 Tax=Macrosiphum euphorbiae TaxID=13131 RepID=A0AAV0XR04_9HEMI|nr:unnamed protein product [Macrosiphum euphorbiae]
MIGSRIELITSERGKELALVNLYKHRFVGYRKKDGALKWRCSTNKNCTAIIFSTPEKILVCDVSGSHNHDADPQSKLDRQVLRENCKRKAEESISCRPVKIIRTELLKTQLAIKCSDITSVRKAMYDKRRKIMSSLPKSLNEALEQLRNLQLDDSFMYKNQQFIHAPPNEQFVCITTANNISFLIKNCTELFGDGTFEYCPKYFMQLYTIHGLKREYTGAILTRCENARVSPEYHASF